MLQCLQQGREYVKGDRNDLSAFREQSSTLHAMTKTGNAVVQLAAEIGIAKNPCASDGRGVLADPHLACTVAQSPQQDFCLGCIGQQNQDIREIPGAPYISFTFGPGFLSLSGRSSNRSSLSMKASSPMGLPVRSCFLKRAISDS